MTNPILTMGIAALLALGTSADVLGKPNKQGKGNRGGGRAAVSKPAKTSHAAFRVQRSQPRAKRSVANVQRSKPRAIVRSSPQVRRSIAAKPRVNYNNNFARNRNVKREVNVRNRNVNIERNTRINRYRTGNTYVNRGHHHHRRHYVPYNIHRHWDRKHVHSWNNNRYRWWNNAWVVIGSPYYYSTPSYYSYDYDVTPSYYSYSSLPAVGSNTVAEVQEELYERGYSPGPIDGILGSATRNAIANFQADEGLAVTGTINRALLDELGV